MEIFIIKTISHFWEKAIPGWAIIVRFSIPLFLYAVVAAWFSGWLRKHKNLQTAYTRKVFHFLIFTAAGVLQMIWGLQVVVLFGVITSLIVLYGVWRGRDHAFYEALARPKDQPQRTLFILIPLLTTVVGGIISNIFFYRFAFIGYLVGGWGDAIAEPVGAKWGHHPYKVPSLAGIPATRTLEGSASVAIMSFIAAFTAFLFLGYGVMPSLYTALACSIGGALIEAVSHHGLDNLTIQVVAAAIATLLLA